MGGGLIQLSAYGSENQYLNGNPQITYFKSVYKRHTNFALETIEVTFDTTLDELSFSDPIKLKVKIPRNGDLINAIYFKFNVPDVKSDNKKQFYWVKKLGVSIIDYVDIYIGGSKIERLYGEYIDLINSVTMSSDKVDTFNEMIGNSSFMSYNAKYKSGYYPGYDFNKYVEKKNKRFIKKFYKSPPGIFERHFNIPLNFWFSKASGTSLPIIALQYHDIELEIQLKPAKDLYTILEDDKTYYYYTNNKFSEGELSNCNKNNCAGSKERIMKYREKMASLLDTDNKYIGMKKWESKVRIAPNDGNNDHHISNFIYGRYINGKTWDLGAKLNIDYIFLDKDERKNFAASAHEYLIESVIKIEDTTNKESAVVRLETFHPCKEILFTLSRTDNYTRNEWLNYTSRPKAPLSNTSAYDYQDNWWHHCCNIIDNKSDELILEKGPIIFKHPEDGNILCDKFQELIFRFGPNGESKYLNININDSILGFMIENKDSLYSIDKIIDWKNTSWMFTKAQNIPNINEYNYEIWRSNPLVSAKIQFNGQTREETHRHEYFSQVQPYRHHRSMQLQPIYMYSFAITPDSHQPSGTANFSRIKNVDFILNIKNTPISKKQLTNKHINITKDWGYDIKFYIISYNILKIMGGLGGLVFS